MACLLCSCQMEARNMKRKATVNQAMITLSKRRTGTLLGVRETMSSSTASRQATARTRTLTSHASHVRSLNRISPIFQPVCMPVIGLRTAMDLLSGQLGDHREERHVQGNDDAADGDAEKADHNGLQQGQH